MTCPLCGASDADRIAWKGGYHVVRCRVCRLGFIDPMPSESELRGFYERRYFAARQESTPATSRRRASRRYRLFRRLIHQGKLPICSEHTKVLEVGTGHGWFLRALHESGWLVEGVELSDRERQGLQSQGLTVHADLTQLIDARKESYGLIVCWHVLEHVVSPVEFVTCLNQLLVPNGFLLIATPNWQSFESRLAGIGWEWLSPPSHVLYFGRTTLCQLLERSGFQVVKDGTRRGDAGNIIYDFVFGLAYSLFGRRFASASRSDQSGLRERQEGPLRNWVLEILRIVTAPLQMIVLPLLMLFAGIKCGPELYVLVKKK
jgi:SAM-dependent methyltransferase